ncbi:MAG: lytic transglycosylase domain-containing protein [Acidobacteria bacterium]|nr:MAG: lytic transglycosylase domain-containing protein [Acidobacteriota bacterium]
MGRIALITTLAVGILSLSLGAEAQIFTYRDATGTLVLSDRAPADAGVEVRTFDAANTTEPVRVTRPVSRGYKGDYDELIVKYAGEQGIRTNLVRAVVQVESGYNPRAISPKGAMGLMQLMPKTAARLGVRRPFDPEENIRGGVLYLRQLLDRFDNNEELALAAYNAGPLAVDRYGNRVPPYRETRDYVKKVRSRTPVSAAPKPKLLIYKYVEMVGDKLVTRYSDTKPATGPYEVLDPSK